MNQNTTDLLQKLADKLGTTAQYLWSVLMHQAAISATIDIIQILLLIIITFITYKVFKRVNKYYTSDNEKGEDWSDGILPAVCFFIVGLIIVILWIPVFCYGIPEIINGYFHPEYWSLQQILDTLTQHN